MLISLELGHPLKGPGNHGRQVWECSVSRKAPDSMRVLAIEDFADDDGPCMSCGSPNLGGDVSERHAETPTR